jgi:hypothetical protein
MLPLSGPGIGHAGVGMPPPSELVRAPGRSLRTVSSPARPPALSGAAGGAADAMTFTYERKRSVTAMPVPLRPLPDAATVPQPVPPRPMEFFDVCSMLIRELAII